MRVDRYKPACWLLVVVWRYDQGFNNGSRGVCFELVLPRPLQCWLQLPPAAAPPATAPSIGSSGETRDPV